MERKMKRDYSTINTLFKNINNLRERTNIADFFFSPHIVHLSKVLPHEISEVHEQRIFEISLLLSGEMIYTIDSHDVSVQAGDVVIIPPHAKHYWRVLGADSEILSFMVHISKHGDGSRRDFSQFNDSIRRHLYCLRSFNDFEQIIQQIIAEIIDHKAAYKDKILYLIKIAFIELIRKLFPAGIEIRHLHNSPPARGGHPEDIVERIHYYIQDNIDHPITLREVSAYIGMSMGHLSHVFKMKTKTTINQTIINKKLEWSCRYLKQTDRQVKDIAALVGYNDANYFYLQFKKKYGVTPSLYRYGK